MLLVINILLGFVMLSGMISGLFTKSFCFKLSYSKTRKLRASLENHLAALKLNLNKKGVWKADLNYCGKRKQYQVHLNNAECSNNLEKLLCPAFAGRQVLFLASRQEMKSGLG